MLRVFIADDSPLMRERLVEAISAVAGTELVGQAEDALGAIQTIQRLRPDVAILSWTFGWLEATACRCSRR